MKLLESKPQRKPGRPGRCDRFVPNCRFGSRIGRRPEVHGMGAIEMSRWIDENFGDLRIRYLTDCVHSEHVFTVRREVRTAGEEWERDPDVLRFTMFPGPGDGVRYRAALED